MSAAAFGLACLGCLLLSLSLKRHYRQVWPESTDYQQWIIFNRTLGYVCIFLAVVPCIYGYGLWIGLVLWVSVLALAAFAQTLLLTYWPTRSLLVSGASVTLLLIAGLLA